MSSDELQMQTLYRNHLSSEILANWKQINLTTSLSIYEKKKKKKKSDQ